MVKREPCDIFAVAAKCGVRLRPVKERYAGPLRPMDCFCRGALRRIGRKHGEGHLSLTLRLIVETGGNAGELYQETVTGISSLLIRHPFLVDRGLALFDAFDRIDLAKVRRRGKALAVGRRVQETVATLLALQLLSDDEIDALPRAKAA